MQLDIELNKEAYDARTELAEEYGFGLSITDFAHPDERTDVDALCDWYEQQGVQAETMHGPFKDIYIHSDDPDVAAVAKQRVRTTLRIADALDIPLVIFHTNILPQIREPSYHDAWVERNMTFWKEQLTYHNCTVALENMWDRSPTALKQVVSNVDKLGACLDIGHWNVFSDTSLESWFTALGDNILYVHLNDNHGTRDAGLPIGQGSIDWHAVTTYLDQYKIDRALLEVPRDHIQPSVTFIQKHGLF
jgi:sugar phosphate isomerase/epimerase